MSPNSSPPRRSLLQFSLRGMLLLMVLIGVGLAIYRWPWTEEKFLNRDKTLKEVTSYHRGWNGKPVKHGVRTVELLDSDRNVDKHFYVEGELRRVERWRGGQVRRIQNYRQGELDGPSWSRMELGATRYTRMDCTDERGTYRQGKKVGEWVVRYQFAGAWYTSWKPFEDDLPHGEWIWKDTAGKVLQTAHFERGELVRWNDLAIHGDLKPWFVRERISAESQAVLALPAENIDWRGSRWIGHFGVTEFELRGTDQKLEIAGAGDNQDLLNSLRKQIGNQPADTVAMSLLKGALQENYTLISRAGLPCLVPITPGDVDPRDRTGLSQVAFEPGSFQAIEWTSPPPEPLPNEHLDSGFLQSLFVGTSIQIDASDIPTNLPTEFLVRELYKSFGRLPPFCNFYTPHRRCDLLSLILHHQKWSCEQRGNVLILHPYPAEETE